MTGFSPDKFQIDTSAFVNSPNAVFTIDLINNSLVLTFAPVPEPAAVLAVAGAGLAAAGWLRRRRAKVAVLSV